MPGKCQFQELWLMQPDFRTWLQPGESSFLAKCSLCMKQFNIEGFGIDQLRAHATGKKHKRHERTRKYKLGHYFCTAPSDATVSWVRGRGNPKVTMKKRSATGTKALKKKKRKIMDETKENGSCPSKTEDNQSTMSNQVPALTKPAPIFKGTAVENGEFKEISLLDYAGKYVVFFFYPLDFTFVCPTEIIAFSDRAEEFRSIGCEVIACSTDSHFSHLAWVNTPRKDGGLGEMNIPLLADKSMNIAKAYGVLKEEDGIAFRGLFIIDGNGILRQATINDLPVGRDVDETLRLVQAFQFTDEHGEVCPAGWKPGAKTMKADPAGSKEYFQSEN